MVSLKASEWCLPVSVVESMESLAEKPQDRIASPVIAQEAWCRIVQTCSHTTDALSDALSRFWGIPVRTKFFSASARPLYFWRMDEFYVSQLALQEEAIDAFGIAQLRLSDQACSDLLISALGASHRPFRFEQISGLEGQLLNAMSREIFLTLTQSLIKRRVKHQRKSPLVYLVWLLYPEVGEARSDANVRFTEPSGVGKLVLTVPLSALRLMDASQQPESELLAETVFDHAQIPVTLNPGTAKLTLMDLQSLEPGDLVILDQSRPDRMRFRNPQTGKLQPFSVQLTDTHLFTVPYTQEMMMMETQQMETTKKMLWDNLMIDVSAEFDPVKLPLKQLRQMSEGLVVELGDLTRNRIHLVVEGKALATGELVIVGDKFGVRIHQVEVEPPSLTNSDTSPMAQDTQVPAAFPVPEGGQPPALAPGEASEADDFLNDNFDETDFDEDEW